jgi:branched-chain amino acid transport system permease protein
MDVARARKLPLVRTRSLPRLLPVVVVCAAVIFVWAMYSYGTTSQLYFWTTVAETILFAMAVNLLFGQAGMLSFGQAAYFGLGAYAVALYANDNMNPLLMLGLAAAVGAVTSLIVGTITLRTTELVFAMLTLAFGMSLYSITFEVQRVGGENGLVGVFPSNLFGFELANSGPLWVFESIVVGVGVALLWVVSRSPFGRTLKMIRDDPHRAEVLGISVFRYRLGAFVLSGALCGVAGALYVWVQTVASPDVLFWTTSGTPVIVSLLGGIHVFLGPVVGAMLYTWATDTLSQLTSAWIFWIGCGFLFVVLVAPEGILGGALRLWKWYGRRQQGKSEST